MLDRAQVISTEVWHTNAVVPRDIQILIWCAAPSKLACPRSRMSCECNDSRAHSRDSVPLELTGLRSIRST